MRTEGAMVDQLNLLKRLQAGEDDAARTLVREYWPRIYGFMKCLVHSREVAEDLTQEALLRACRKCRQIRKPDRFETWLFTLARHMAYKQLKRARRIKETPWDQEWVEGVENPDARDPVRDMEIHQARRLLAGALDSLSGKRREIMALRYYSGLSHREIAEVMGVPIGSIGATITRSLEAMKKYFDSKGLKVEDLI